MEPNRPQVGWLGHRNSTRKERFCMQKPKRHCPSSCNRGARAGGAPSHPSPPDQRAGTPATSRRTGPRVSGRWRGALRGRAPGPPPRCRSPTRWPRARRDPARQRRGRGTGARGEHRHEAGSGASRCRAKVRVPVFNARLFSACGGGSSSATTRDLGTSPRGDAGMAGWQDGGC